MTNQISIIASVPTHHNATDLRIAFNMPIKAYLGGVHEASEEFLNVADARAYLIQRLDRHRDASDMTEEDYIYQYENIHRGDLGYLELSNITAWIDLIEIEEEEEAL